MKVLRYGHLRSARVVVDVGVRTGWEPPTLRAALSVSTRPTWAPPRWLPASPTTRTRVCAATDQVWLRARRSKTSREMQSEANEDREDAETSCVQRSISPLLHALAGCGRRCAVLIFEEIGPSSTQHRVGVASFRSEQQYLYGISTIFRFRAQVMSQ